MLSGLKFSIFLFLTTLKKSDIFGHSIIYEYIELKFCKDTNFEPLSSETIIKLHFDIIINDVMMSQQHIFLRRPFRV